MAHTKAKKFKPGDKVKHGPTSPELTVLTGIPNAKGEIECSWFNKAGNDRTKFFPVDLLTAVEPNWYDDILKSFRPTPPPEPA